MDNSVKETKGVIYILTNPSFPEYVKIGYADDLEKRLKGLNRSECIPYAFRVYAVYDVNERLQDISIHSMIDSINPNLRAIETFDGKKRKKEFYAMSADDAYAIFETIATLSGTLDRLHKMKPEGHEIIDEAIAEEIESKNVYAEESHLDNADNTIVKIYNGLKDRLLALDGVSIVPKKLYIAFKLQKNICDIVIQKHRMGLFLNMPKGSLNDPRDIAEDVSQKGHWGNGDYCIMVDDSSDVDYIFSLIKQSYLNNK